MLVYNYDGATGEFIGSSEADLDPLESTEENPVYLVPANATMQAPPPAMPGNVVAFGDGKWGYVKIVDGAVTQPSDTPHPPSVEDVVAERERRLQLGFTYDFGDVRAVHFFATTPADMEGWDEVTKLANAYLLTGDTTSTIAIKTQTGPTEVTATEWQKVLIAAGNFRQPIFAASFMLQSVSPIPDDYKDDKYWPDAQGNAPHVEMNPTDPLNVQHVTAPWMPITGDPNNAPYIPPTE